jgi:HD-GYP domain-containing protein (c-di-GMP phosphodiesterase class II)
MVCMTDSPAGLAHIEGVVDGVLATMSARDEGAAAHADAAAAWCRRIAEAMDLSATLTGRIVTAAALHDIGTIATPDAIRCKPGPLTRDESTVVRAHANVGADVLAQMPALAPYAPIVRAHHERWDGLGYPYGLKGVEIPFEARVVAVADALDAMISPRPYRRAIAQRDALEILRHGRGTQWDASVVDAVLGMLQRAAVPRG